MYALEGWNTEEDPYAKYSLTLKSVR